MTAKKKKSLHVPAKKRKKDREAEQQASQPIPVTEMIRAALAQDKNSPAVNDNGVLFARFNSIQIRNAPGKKGINLGFFWNGKMVHLINVPLAAQMAFDDTINVTGLEGRIPIKITAG